MAYRNPNRTRIGQQSDTIFQYGGQTATLRSYISASAGVSVAGFGSTLYYRERTITALFAPLPANPEAQTPAGMLAADQFQVTTREPIGRRDELRWRGNVYRIESDPSPATLNGFWVALVKRGEST